MTERSLLDGLWPSVAGAAILAACSTFGDWLWANYIPDGAMVPGIVHGALIFLILAAVLSFAVGTRRAAKRLMPALPAAGVLIAAAFYPLARLTGYIGGLMITWVIMWLATATLLRWASGARETIGQTLLRGAAAAIGSGLAFWAISGIWTNPSPTGPNYLWHFACWAFAFLPGFLALLLGRVSPSAP